jgi:hypothetical protein
MGAYEFLRVLATRGFIHQVSEPEALDRLAQASRIAAYIYRIRLHRAFAPRRQSGVDRDAAVKLFPRACLRMASALRSASIFVR